MLQVNRSAATGSNEKSETITGNPNGFFGYCLLAFIDLLGFSTSVANQWSEQDDSPLCRILRIKKAFTDGDVRINVRNTKDKKDSREITARIHTVSDSLVIAVAVDNPFPYQDLIAAKINLIDRITHIWKQAIKEGYTIRGAVEFGQIYWSETETIGPAFQDAYALENQVANWSRVIVGPSLIALLDRLVPPGYPIDSRSNLMISPDGLLEIEPLLIKQDLDRLGPLVPKRGYLRKKYEPLLAHLTGEKRLGPVTEKDWQKAKQKLERVAWRS